MFRSFHYHEYQRKNWITRYIFTNENFRIEIHRTQWLWITIPHRAEKKGWVRFSLPVSGLELGKVAFYSLSFQLEIFYIAMQCTERNGFETPSISELSSQEKTCLDLLDRNAQNALALNHYHLEVAQQARVRFSVILISGKHSEDLFELCG